jgi:hypothetical protein
VSLHRSAGLVVFAPTGLTGSIALDERSGEIVQLTNLRRRWISPSVTEFTALATSVAAWFDQSDNSLPSDRVIGFRPQVEARYPTSFTDSDGYWAALLDDIAIGDYDYR